MKEDPLQVMQLILKNSGKEKAIQILQKMQKPRLDNNEPCSMN